MRSTPTGGGTGLKARSQWILAVRNSHRMRNSHLDAAELAVIASVLVGAIAEGGARAREFGTDAQFREIVRQAREIHDLLIEALIENEPLSTEILRDVANTMDNSIEELEALAELPDEMARDASP
jgi:hypothetical protein